MRTQARARAHCANLKIPTNAGACHVLIKQNPTYESRDYQI